MAQIILNVGWAVFKEFIGWNEVVSCFSRGDMWACGSLIIDAIPWFSVFSKGKKIWRAVDKTLSAISAWRKAQEKARKIIAAAKAAREAAKAAAAAAKAAAKKAAQAAAKRAQQAAIRAAKKGAEKTGNPLQKTKKAIAKGNEKVKSVAQKVTGKNKKENGRDGVAEEAPSGNGASCPRPNSFVPGTLVVMADGSTKPIEKVKNGDEVLATNPETGETTPEVVTAEITGEGFKHLVKVTIDTDGDEGDKTASVTATDSHPFWVEALGEWVEATDLKPGEWLRTSAGTYVQITAVERWTAPDATVHNLTVNDLHTYYVLAGDVPVLVHNIDLSALNSCPTGATTHTASVTVHDSSGTILHDYDIRSGAQTPAEKAMGGRAGETLSHTENRAARMAGGVSSYGTKLVKGDEFFLEKPVPVDGYVIINGSRSPCSSCMGAMRRGAEDTGSTFVYIWEEAGKPAWWGASG